MDIFSPSNPKLLAHIIVGQIAGPLPFACTQTEPAFPRREPDLAEPRALRNASASSDPASTIGTENIVPVDARTTFGLCTSVVRSQTMTAAAFAASAERRIVPRLPGFSIASVTRTSAWSGSFRSARVTETCGPTISKPSGRSL